MANDDTLRFDFGDDILTDVFSEKHAQELVQTERLARIQNIQEHNYDLQNSRKMRIICSRWGFIFLTLYTVKAGKDAGIKNTRRHFYRYSSASRLFSNASSSSS